MDIITAIQNQVDTASPIMEQIISLDPVLVRGYPGSECVTSGKKRYNKEAVSLVEENLNNWQSSAKAILSACFPTNSKHYEAFDRTIVTTRMYYDAKEELKKELNEGLNVLNAVILEENMKMELQTANSKSSTMKSNKKPLVFISHRSTQEAFVTALVNLLENCGFSKENLFCSSVPGFNIGLGEDIIETLKEKFVEYDLYVLYVLSTDFFESAYCLNEMGAAWALQVKYDIIATRTLNEKKIEGVISKTKTRISFKDTPLQLEDRMIQLRDKLLTFASLPKIEEINWRRYYLAFQDQISHGVVESQKISKRQETTQPPISYNGESPDSVLNDAINKLGEFTIRQLQNETGFKDYHYIAKKVQAMVISGELEGSGSNSHRKYRVIIKSNPLF